MFLVIFKKNMVDKIKVPNTSNFFFEKSQKDCKVVSLKKIILGCIRCEWCSAWTEKDNI